MEVKRKDLKNHATSIAAVLQDVCDAFNTGPLVQENDESGNIVIIITHWNKPFSRQVMTDLGGSESALRLPIPDAKHPRYWIGLHERWEPISKYKIRFRDCGLRLYVGSEEEQAVQILRLEWVAPNRDPDGDLIYDGKHAGHPHWHIDRSALIGPEDYWRSLEIQTAPAAQVQHEPEVFNENTVSQAALERPIHDCSWLQQLHLPAQAGWMQAKWNGSAVPGPHQSEPTDLGQLDGWWTGALRYLVSELGKAS